MTIFEIISLTVVCTIILLWLVWINLDWINPNIKFKFYLKCKIFLNKNSIIKSQRYVDSLRQTFLLVKEDLKEIEYKLINIKYDKDLIYKTWNLEFEIKRTLIEFDDIDFWTNRKYYRYYDKLWEFEKRMVSIRKLNDILNEPKGQRFIPIDPFGEENWED